MKKFLGVISVALICVLSICMFNNTIIGNKKQVRAKGLEDGQMLVVVGVGEVEVKPDTVEVYFGLKSRAENLADGQKALIEKIDTVKQNILQFDNEAKVFVNYSSSYPVADNGLLTYEFDSCLVAKSGKIDDVEGFVNTIANAGATSVQYTKYCLTNRESAYIDALIEARNNADKKIKALYNNATLKALKEENVFNFCCESTGEKIKVCAKVKACYTLSNTVQEVGNITTNVSANNDNKNTINKESKQEIIEDKTEVKESNTTEKNEIDNGALKEITIPDNAIVAADNTIVRTDNLTLNSDKEAEKKIA